MFSESLAQNATGERAESHRPTPPGPIILPLFDLRTRVSLPSACGRVQPVDNAIGPDSSTSSAARGHGSLVATTSHTMHATREHVAPSNAISPKGGSSSQEADPVDASLYVAGSNAADSGTASLSKASTDTVGSEAARSYGAGSNAAVSGAAGSENAASDTVALAIDRHLIDLGRRAASDHDTDPAYMNSIESEHDDEEDNDDSVSVQGGMSSDPDQSDDSAGSPTSRRRSGRLPHDRTEPLAQYEIDRMNNIQRNNAMLESLGILEAKVAIRPVETAEQSNPTHRTSPYTTQCCS